MIGTELLDDRRADPRAVRNELRDIARLNTLFGGTRAVVEALEPFFRDSCNVQPATCNVHRTLLDVGTGSGDIALAAVTAARRHGITLTAIGLEVIPAAARLTRANGVEGVLGDGGALPFGPKSVDIVIASQVLHHLPGGRAGRSATLAHRDGRRVAGRVRPPHGRHHAARRGGVVAARVHACRAHGDVAGGRRVGGAAISTWVSNRGGVDAVSRRLSALSRDGAES